MKNQILALLIGASFINAAGAQEVARDKIGLVLSGGGARGLAHLGVIKALEEQKIPIDYIAGTSAGALIGGMYASGMSVAEIEEKIKDMDLGAVAFAPAERRELKQNVRNLDYQANSIVDVSVTQGGKVTLPIAVSNGAKVEAVLRDLLKNQPYNTDFEKLPIPFNAVAADLSTGKMVVLKQGQLAHALRASMSIPAVFAPVEMDGRLLVDGMIDRNMPVDVARKMGATRIIAVDVGSGLLKKEQLDSVVAVSEQMLSLLVKRNVDEQVATLTERDILIRPELGELGNLDFKEGKQAASQGYQALQQTQVKKKLATFAVAPHTYTALMSKHALPAKPDVKIDYVRIETHGLAHPESLRHEVHMQDGSLFDLNVVNADIARLMSAGRISNVEYKINKAGHKTELVYQVTERDEARNSIRAGVEVASNSLSDQQFALHLSHRNIWLNRLGGEWRNHLSIGKRTQLTSEINQPLNASGSVFIRPSLDLAYEKRPAYINGNSQIATEYAVQRGHYGFIVGSPLGRVGEWGAGLSYRYANLKGNANNPSLVIGRDSIKNISLDAEITLDQLDDAFIPTDGYFIRAYAQVGLNKSNNTQRYVNGGVRGLYALGNATHSLAVGVNLAGHNSERSVYLSPYSLGGYHNLSGYARNQLIGNYMAYSSLTYRYRTPWRILNNPLILGASLEAGNTWQNARQINPSDLKFSSSVFGALRTPIGPAQLGVGLTRTGKTKLYFFIGRTFTDGQ